MLFDFRELPANAPLDADVCIAGAGAAGITLARALIARGRRVTLLESG
ncbi:MAG: NAD(P)-binding protein, partial [Gammaproteobacteria bacterium]